MEKLALSEATRAEVQIVDFPEGMPGDVGITLRWA